MKDLKEHPTKVPVLGLKGNKNQDNGTTNLRPERKKKNKNCFRIELWNQIQATSGRNGKRLRKRTHVRLEYFIQ